MKGIKLYILLSMLLLCISCELVKQEEDVTPKATGFKMLTGKIVDESTNNGIEGVLISIGGLTAKTDGKGNFEFGTDLLEGTYTLTATKTNFISLRRNVKIVSGNSSIASYSMFAKSSGTVINAASGGTILQNSLYEMSIPPGALPQNTEISITPVLGAGIPLESSNRFTVDAIYLEPSGLTFLKPITIKIPNRLQFLDPSKIKAVSINSTTFAEEALNVSVVNNSLVVSLNHFSTVESYSTENIRTRTVAYFDTTATTTICDCNTEKATAEVTISSKIISTSIPETIIKAELGVDIKSSISSVLELTRKKGEDILQLYYQVSGTRYILEKQEGNVWNSLAVVEIPSSIKVVPKKVGSCHNQGGVN